MLDETVPDRYKVLNTPMLTRWNSSMPIHSIITQLMQNYSMPNAMVMFDNDTLFCSLFPASEAPEMLFIALNSAKRSKPSIKIHIRKCTSSMWPSKS
jgi:hypothetical protein